MFGVKNHQIEEICRQYKKVRQQTKGQLKILYQKYLKCLEEILLYIFMLNFCVDAMTFSYNLVMNTDNNIMYDK